MDKKVDFSKGIKIIISPAEGGYACGIINEKIDMSDDSVYLCHIVAQGMIKFAMEHPQDAFDLGLEQVNNLEESIKSFKNSIVISKPSQAILFDYRRVVFLLTPIGIVELLEMKRDI